MMLKQLRYLLLLSFLFCVYSTVAYAQSEITVNGVITEAETGEPLPGVNIIISGMPDRGTVSDIDGNYSLRVGTDDTLVFSYVGFLTQQVSVDGRTTIDIALQTDIAALAELVVIGYGVQERGDNTGSINVVSARDFNPGAITSPQDLFQGRAAGVDVVTNSGAPGAGATIRIRGGSSLSASNDPLFVVDGLPLDDDGIDGMRNPLNTINPNDIENITILKDASAAAIYGSRASNGVVIITTKRGRRDQPLQLNYSSTFSYQTNNDRINVLSADQFRNVIQDVHGENAAQYLGSANTNWQDQVFRDAFSQDHNISATGSWNNLPYRVSIGFTGNQGVLKTSSNDRLTGSLALSPSFLDDQLRVDINLRGMQDNNRFANTGAIGAAIAFDPTQPVRAGSDNDEYGGYFTWLGASGGPIGIAPANPVALIEQRTDESTVYRALGNVQFAYDLPFLDDLTATLNLGFDYSDVGNGRVRVPDNAAFEISGTNPADPRGIRSDYDQRKENEILDFYLNYDRDLGSINSALDLTLGYSWEHHYSEGSSYTTNFNTGDVLNVMDDNAYATEYYIVSFFGRANYTLRDRYLFTATLRQDGTSRFSSDNRWGLFPSFAFAWQLHEESFLQNSRQINELKLRLGYGVTGQQRIGQGDYPYLARYTFGQPTAGYYFGDEYIQTLRPEGYNAGLKWEETTTYNIGIDYSLFGERIFGSLEAYHRETTDLLNVIPVPMGTNFTNQILTNVGNLEVQGLEFSITSRLLSTENSYWQVGLNATYNRDEITSLTNVDDPAYQGVQIGEIAGGTGNTVQINSVGHPRSSFYVFEQVYDENGRPIEGVFVDRDGDGSISENDRYRYESPSADFTFGLSSRYEYKNWDASFSARASLNNYVYNNVSSDNSVYNEMYNSAGYLTNNTTSLLKTGFLNPQYMSDYYVENASYIRMDNISVGYTFGSLFSSSSSLRVSATMQNVFTITEYSGQDPEVVGGIDYNLYPRPKTFVLGLNLNF